MKRNTSWIVNRFGIRGARIIAVAVMFALALLIAGYGLLIVADELSLGQRPKAAANAVLAVLAIGFCWRIFSNLWRSLRRHSEEIQKVTEDTGNWGVGGPSMRQPGATGSWMRPVDRRSSDRDEDDGA
jgi:hypothetical protein